MGRWALPLFTIVAIFYLLIPIVVMIIFSFNDYAGKFNFIWHGFTLKAWQAPLAWPGLPDAIRISLTIAALSTIFSTILGTMIGLALTRYQFRGRGAINGLIFLPMASPDIVLGASLLTLFINIGLGTGITPPGLAFLPKGTLSLGFTTILIAHIMFNISYVVVTVKARVSGFDRRLEEAAMDLGADAIELVLGMEASACDRGGGFFGRYTGPRASREELLERMRDHIHTVVGRYKGKIKVWDVVNEALSDDGTNVLRNSLWLEIIGPDFIARAFEYAHEADPDAILRYNDYSLENPAKRRKLIALIKSLQEQKVPVMAIGSQAHVNVSTSFEEMDAALTELETHPYHGA